MTSATFQQLLAVDFIALLVLQRTGVILLRRLQQQHTAFWSAQHFLTYQFEILLGGDGGWRIHRLIWSNAFTGLGDGVVVFYAWTIRIATLVAASTTAAIVLDALTKLHRR